MTTTIPRQLDEALQSMVDQNGTNLLEMSADRPTLIVFLRHAGCTFCRETLSDLSRQQHRIASDGLAVAIVTMSSPKDAARMAERYGLQGISWISDPDRKAYSAFELQRGSLGQLFGLKVWSRGIRAMLQGHGIGWLDGDGLQMPGAFVVHKGRLLRSHRHISAADRPDYTSMCCTLEARAPSPEFSSA